MQYKTITNMLRDDVNFHKELTEAWKDNYEIKDVEDVIKLSNVVMDNVNIESDRDNIEEYEIFKDFMCTLGRGLRIGKDKFSIRRFAKTIDGMYVRRRIVKIDKYRYVAGVQDKYFTNEIDEEVYEDFIDVIKADTTGAREAMIDKIVHASGISTMEYLDIDIIEKIIAEEKEANRYA